MKLLWDKGKHCTDTFLLPQSWNSFRRIQPFISLLLLLCLCVINTKAHCGDTNVCISFLHTCSSAREHQWVYSFSIYNMLVIWLCFPINPLWWWKSKSCLSRRQISALGPPWCLNPLVGCLYMRGGAPFNRCCVALEGIIPIKISH